MCDFLFIGLLADSKYPDTLRILARFGLGLGLFRPNSELAFSGWPRTCPIQAGVGVGVGADSDKNLATPKHYSS